MRGNTWSWEVHWNQGEVLKGLAGGGCWLRVVLTAAEAMAGRRRCVRAWGEMGYCFYKRARQWGVGELLLKAREERGERGRLSR
jgi:hypothetical protein